MPKQLHVPGKAISCIPEIQKQPMVELEDVL